ncbi:MAG: hypothetical protein RMI91_12620 [Gemmatales bacterium]|nr:hypothetical protein [Gemmatales bacterium]MDW7995486.1 hypothetical protein [Gemmatales bacterium]
MRNGKDIIRVEVTRAFMALEGHIVFASAIEPVMAIITRLTYMYHASAQFRQAQEEWVLVVQMVTKFFRVGMLLE